LWTGTTTARRGVEGLFFWRVIPIFYTADRG